MAYFRSARPGLTQPGGEIVGLHKRLYASLRRL